MPRCRSRGSVVIPIPEHDLAVGIVQRAAAQPTIVGRGMPVAGQAIEGADLVQRCSPGSASSSSGQPLSSSSRVAGWIHRGRNVEIAPTSFPPAPSRATIMPPSAIRRQNRSRSACIDPAWASLAARDRGSHRCRDRSPARRSGRASRRHLQGGGLPVGQGGQDEAAQRPAALPELRHRIGLDSEAAPCELALEPAAATIHHDRVAEDHDSCTPGDRRCRARPRRSRGRPRARAAPGPRGVNASG